MKFTENGCHWIYVTKQMHLAAYSVREEDGDRLMLICPCQDTIQKLVTKEKQYDYYLGKIWQDVSTDRSIR